MEIIRHICGQIYGRSYTLTDADPWTKEFYAETLGSPLQVRRFFWEPKRGELSRILANLGAILTQNEANRREFWAIPGNSWLKNWPFVFDQAPQPVPADPYQEQRKLYQVTQFIHHSFVN